mgnify:CR=1 FL=1|jgi:hypothetical protein
MDCEAKIRLIFETMNSNTKKSILIFTVSIILIGIILFSFPLNLFPGEIIETSNGITRTIEAPLSLSYFIGFGYEESEMNGVVDFYLTKKGYALAFCLLVGVPLFISLRFYYHKKAKDLNL